jgi:uncharacterized protein YukE
VSQPAGRSEGDRSEDAFAKGLIDYYWNNPRAVALKSSANKESLAVRKLVDWAEYQHYYHHLTGIDPARQYFRGAAVIRYDSRYVIIASDQQKFDEHLEEEIVHVNQTAEEALQLDLSGAHGGTSQQIAAQILTQQDGEAIETGDYLTYELEHCFNYSRADIEKMTPEDKVRVCHMEVQARYAE